MMKLQTKYILFVSILHLLALVLTFFVFRQNQLFFIISEVFILLSVLIAWQLYRQLLQPLQTLAQGINAIRDKDFNVTFAPTGKQEIDELINVYNCMMDELRVERIRQQQQHFFLEKMIQSSPTGILIMDYDEHIYELNPKAEILLGLRKETILNKPLSELTHPILLQVQHLRSGASITFNTNGIDTYKIQKSHFIDRGFARVFVMIEELTAEILAAEKKAYGKVIRMMAHEVNNTLGPVNSIIESALRSEEIWLSGKYASLQNALEVAANRNNNLNQFMRNFADVVRLPDPNKTRFNLNQLITDVARLMKLKAEATRVDFDMQLCESEFMLFADKQQIEQVLINIIKNAMEAIEDAGTIRFITQQHPRLLIISDSGKGIPAGLALDIFSSFFSTKKDGQGIGLTLIRDILLNHQFVFSLETRVPGKTDFTIHF
jgi:two-component system nitrogen regulation sensor histidine kinase NtrY